MSFEVMLWSHAMVAAILQTVTIQSGGTLELRSPEFRAGQTAEVIVLLDESHRPSIQSSLAALDALQKSFALTESSAAEWIRQSAAERQAFGRGL